MWQLNKPAIAAMKTPTFLVVVLAFCLQHAALGSDGASYRLIKTLSGKIYTNCRVFKTDPDGVMFSHQYGGAKVLFSEMTEESRNLLGYDPKKEADYEKARVEKKQKEREEYLKLRSEMAKAQAAAYTAEARRLALINVQSVAGGYGGYGLGWDGGLYSSGYGYGNNYPYGRGYNYNGGYGCSPYYSGYATRGRYRFTTPPNTPQFNVIGRTIHGPQPCKVPLATPAMGPLTPALGAGKH